MNKFLATCDKCNFDQAFEAQENDQAYKAAIHAGWRIELAAKYCPECWRAINGKELPTDSELVRIKQRHIQNIKDEIINTVRSYADQATRSESPLKVLALQLKQAEMSLEEIKRS